MAKAGYKEVRGLLKRFGIPAPRQALVRTGEQAARAARRIGFPLVLKVSSPGIIHKTEKGGVVTGIGTEKELGKAYKKLRGMRGSEGVIVQGMAEGHELILGSRIDSQFGPVIMLGMGGIFVEVLKDVSFRLIPISRKDAREMIREIRGYPILEGVRGKKGIDFRALEDCMLRVSRMAWRGYKSGRPIRELDINPLFAGPEGVLAADVRVIY